MDLKHNGIGPMTAFRESNDKETIARLREENQRLKSKLERLQRQAEALAQANAYASELVAKLDEANDSKQREIDHRNLAEQRIHDVHTDIESEVQRRLASLQSQNESLVREMSERQSEGQEQAELLVRLEKANRELTEFAYVVSHDLKAPLRGIKTLASWIATDHRDSLNSEGQEQIDLLQRRIDRMESLIEGILQYSRAGQSGEKRDPVDLNDLLPNVIDMVAPPEHVVVTVQAGLPTLHGERTRITQVFQNLISNAVKYMDKPAGCIEIGCEEQEERWVFRVTDNGPGIEERHFEKIFKIFQTLTCRDEIESSGIGLAVVRKVVGLYGGQVWVESQVGEGSTFFFSWPKLEALTPTQAETGHTKTREQ